MSRIDEIQKSLTVPYDHVYGPEVSSFPPCAVDGFREDRAAFYSSFYGGFWVLTRYSDIRLAFQDNENFIQHADGLPKNPYSRIHIPLMLNPPDHTKYRKLMTPIFSPRMIARLEPIVREVARAELVKIAPLGKCDFVDDFALALPAATYCGMLGLNPKDFGQFNRLSIDLIFGAAEVMAKEGEAAARMFRERTSKVIDDLLRGLIKDRRADRGDDIISILLDAEVDERSLDDDEILNIASLLFFAGTDSTASMIGYSFMFLAEHPAHREKLLQSPELAGAAAIELIRYHGFHQIRREVAQDLDFAGVRMKKGDLVILPTGGANHDQDKFSNPLEVDFERKNAGGHLSFGAGVHRCIGQHLATLQLKIALEEVHAVIKDYRLDTEMPVEYMTSQAKTVPRRIPMTYSPVMAG